MKISWLTTKSSSGAFSSRTCSKVNISILLTFLLLTGWLVDIGDLDEAIPLPNVSSSVLKKVVHFHSYLVSCIDVVITGRSWPTASIISLTLCQQSMPIKIRTRPASAQLTFRNGIKISSRLIKRCFSRSSWLLIIWISSRFCEFHMFISVVYFTSRVNSDGAAMLAAKLLRT
jgi:hypothetical protein